VRRPPVTVRPTLGLVTFFHYPTPNVFAMRQNMRFLLLIVGALLFSLGPAVSSEKKCFRALYHTDENSELAQFLERYRQDREREAIQEAIEKLIRGETISEFRTSVKLEGINHSELWSKKPTFHDFSLYQQIFLGASNFWVAFERERKLRILLLEHLRDEHSLDMDQQPALAKLHSFSIFEIPFFDQIGVELLSEECRQIFEEHRPKEQRKLLHRAVNKLASDGIALNEDNTADVVGVSYLQLVGLGRYARGKLLGYRRIFDSPPHFWMQYLDKRAHRTEDNQRRLLSNPKDERAQLELKNLTEPINALE